MRKRLADRFVYHLLQPIHKTSVFAVGMYTLTWGLWVANPFWSVFEQAQLFSALGFIAPEVFWGCLAIVCGISIITGALRQSIRSLMAGAAVAYFHWTMIAIFYFVGDWSNTGGITSLALALYAAYLWLNIKMNNRIQGLNPSELFR